MTKTGKWIGFTCAWAAYGALVWALATYVRPARAVSVLAVVGSATYFLLLVTLFFRGRP